MITKKEYRILIVEDNPDHALIIEREFKKHIPSGIIECAENGEACLEKLAWNKYHAVVLDYSLPQMNGLDVLIKIFEDCFDVPVVMISGQGSEDVAVSAMKSGAFDYIVKGPDYATHLITTVVTAIEKHNLKTELKSSKELVKTKDQQLEKREEELQTLDMIKNAMLTNLIHSLKTPLVSIRGYNELIMNEKLGPTTEEQQRGLNVSIKNIDKLLAFIEDYANFDDPANSTHMNITNINLNQLLEDSVTTILPKAINKKVKVSLDSVSSQYHIKGDERRFFQAVINIIDSAILMVASEDIIKIRITENDDDKIIISINSNNYKKNEESEKIVNQNILIAEEIIQFHHGVFTEKIDETTFNYSIQLPLHSSSKTENEEISVVHDENKKGTILIVDDDKDCLDLLSMILANDYNTISIKNGKKMFDVLEEEKIDLILLDINMYDINGIDACRKVKMDSRYSSIPVYMISATLGEDKKQLSLDAGASGFIEKPFEMETILNFISRIFPS